MKKLLTMLGIIFSLLVHGQSEKEAVYKNIEGLTIVDSIAWKDILGGFCISNGYCGCNVKLHSDMSFSIIDFCCVGRFIVDSGTWAIRNNNTVVLKCIKKTLCFEIVRFDQYYFFIQPAERKKFVSDLQSARIELKNANSFTVDGKIISVSYMVDYRLGERYYVKEIEDNDGTQ